MLETRWSQRATSVCKKMAQPSVWWTCLSPVAVDRRVVRPVQVVPVQVAPVQEEVLGLALPVLAPQLRRPKAQVLQDNAQVLLQASPVRLRQRTPHWLDRTHA